MLAVYYSFVFIGMLFTLLPIFFGRRDIGSVLFSLASFCSGIWIYCVLNVTLERTIFWVNGAYVFSGFYIVLNILFSWLYPVKQFRFSKMLQCIFVCWVLVYSILGFKFNFFAVSISEDFVVTYGVGRFFALGIFLLGLLMIVWGSIRSFKFVRYQDRMRSLYYFLGMTLSFSIGTLLVFIMPFFVGSSKYSVYAPLLYPVMMLFHFYSIFKYQLLDIRIIIKRGFVYLVVSGLLSVLFFGILFGLTGQVQSTQFQEIAVMVFVTYLISLVYPLFIKSLNQLTEKIFFRSSYEYQVVNVDYDQRLLLLRTPGDIVSVFAGVLDEALKPKDLRIYFKDELGRVQLFSEGLIKPVFDITLPYVSYFNERSEEMLLLDAPDLFENKVSEYALLGCIRSSKGVQAVVCLGYRFSDVNYQLSDYNLIRSLLNRTAVAMDHVFHYDDIIRYSQMLSRFNLLFVSMHQNMGKQNLLNGFLPLIKMEFIGDFVVQFESNKASSILWADASIEDSSSFVSNLNWDPIFNELGQSSEGILYDSIEVLSDHADLYSFCKNQQFQSVMFFKLESGHDEYDIILSFSKVLLVESMIFSLLISSFYQSIISLYRRVYLYDKIIKTKQYNDAVLESMLVGILVLDSAGNMVHVNKEATRILGKTKSDLIQNSVKTIDLDRRLCSFFQYAHLSTQSTSSEFSLGTDKTLSCASIKLEHFQQVETVCLLADISDFRQLERKLEHSDRLASLSNLSTGVSKEIGLPILNLQNTMKVLDATWTQESEVLHLMNSISADVDHINSLCQSLLRLGKPNMIQFTRVNMVSLFQEAKGLIKGQLQQIEFKESCPNELWLEGDYSQLLQVLLNVLINAIHAHEGAKGLISLTMEEDGKWCKLIIYDKGKGLTKHQLSKIFDPFYTTKSKSNGLGLTIAYRIIQDHQGTIVFSSETVGTTVTIKLPLDSFQIGGKIE